MSQVTNWRTPAECIEWLEKFVDDIPIAAYEHTNNPQLPIPVGAIHYLSESARHLRRYEHMIYITEEAGRMRGLARDLRDALRAATPQVSQGSHAWQILVTALADADRILGDER